MFIRFGWHGRAVKRYRQIGLIGSAESGTRRFSNGTFVGFFFFRSRGRANVYRRPAATVRYSLRYYLRTGCLARVVFAHFARVLVVLEYPPAIGRRFANRQRVIARRQRVDMERVVFCVQTKRKKQYNNDPNYDGTYTCGF